MNTFQTFQTPGTEIAQNEYTKTSTLNSTWILEIDTLPPSGTIFRFFSYQVQIKWSIILYDIYHFKYNILFFHNQLLGSIRVACLMRGIGKIIIDSWFLVTSTNLLIIRLLTRTVGRYQEGGTLCLSQSASKVHKSIPLCFLQSSPFTQCCVLHIIKVLL